MPRAEVCVRPRHLIGRTRTGREIYLPAEFVYALDPDGRDDGDDGEWIDGDDDLEYGDTFTSARERRQNGKRRRTGGEEDGESAVGDSVVGEETESESSAGEDAVEQSAEDEEEESAEDESDSETSEEADEASENQEGGNEQ